MGAELKLVGGRGAVVDAAEPAAPLDQAGHEEITKAVVARLASLGATGKAEFVVDTELPGLRLKKTPAGALSFLYVGRLKAGKVVTTTLGRAHGKGAITVLKARTEAARVRELLRQGINPADVVRERAEASAAAEAARQQNAQRREWTVSHALEQFLAYRASRPDERLWLKPATIRFYKEGIGSLGKLADVPVVELDIARIRAALDKITGAAKPAKVRRALNGVIGYAIDTLDLPIRNPLLKLETYEYAAPPPREGYIKEADIGEFISTVSALPTLSTAISSGREKEAERARDFLLLLLLTGCRRDEVRLLRWDWVDLTKGLVSLPAEVTKQKRPHVIPLTPWGREVLRRRLTAKREGDGYVFAGRDRGTPLSHVRKSAARLPMKFKLHDLRRTLVTHCSALGITGDRLKAMVGHSKADVTARYDQREIEQVRRDFLSYHDWLLARHRVYEQFANLPPSLPPTQEELAADAALDAWDAERAADSAFP